MRNIFLTLACVVDGRRLQSAIELKDDDFFQQSRVLCSDLLQLHTIPSSPSGGTEQRRSKVLRHGRIDCRDCTFAILEDHHPERPGLQLVGSRKGRKSFTSVDSFKRQLSAAQLRQDELKKMVEDLEKRPSANSYAFELQNLKRKKLQVTDRVVSLSRALRRLEESHAWELGHGHFGQVLLGRDRNSKLVAIKIADYKSTLEGNHATSRSSLEIEAIVLQELSRKGEDGFPRYLHFGRQGLTLEGSRREADVLVMELLGPSIEDLWFPTNAGTQFSAGCVHRIAVQMLERLQRLHSAGWVHNDVKPANFLMGLPSADEAKRKRKQHRRIYLADMGLCTQIAQPANRVQRSAFGTLFFASRAAHAGKLTMPEDDIESLCYCLAYLLMGRLPWGGLEDETKVAAAKEEVARSNGEQLFIGRQDDDEAVLIVSSYIIALWCAQEQQRCEEQDVGDPAEQALPAQTAYSYGAAWPEKCRAAMKSVGEIDIDLEEDAYDWEAAGLEWSCEGEMIEVS